MNSVSHDHVKAEFCSIGNVTDVADPVAGTLPVPVQPVQKARSRQFE